MMRKINYIVFFITALFIHTVRAWCPVCHYAIARDCGFSHEEAGLFNLPDAWDSYKLIYLEGDSLRLYAITDNFCWSHSVARTGRTVIASLDIGLPLVPSYHLEREPGAIIKNLIENSKVLHWGAANSQTSTEGDPVKTALYMSGHNAADYNVHWSYFGGGSLNGWYTEHKIKEEWCDYAIAARKKVITFNEGGEIASFYGYAVSDHDYPMPFDVNRISCHALRLSQLIIRKSRAFLEENDFINKSNNPYVYDSVNSMQEIHGLVSKLKADINDSIRVMNQERYDELTAIARNNQWITVKINPQTHLEEDDYSLLLNIYSESVKNFKNIIINEK